MRAKCLLLFDSLLAFSICVLVFSIPISKAGIEIFFTISLIFFFAKKITKPDSTFLKDRLNIFLFLFMSFSALSLINSAPYRGISLKALFFKWFEYLLIYAMVRDALTDKKRIQYAFFIFLVTSIFVGMDGIIQRALGYDLLWQRSLMQLKNGALAITATFSHYNGFGAYLLFPLAFVLASLIQKEKNNASQVGFFLLAVLFGICLLLTFSRGAWLGFFGILFFMLYLAKHARTTLIFLILFVSFIFLIPFFRSRLLDTFVAGGESDRFIFWKASWMMIKENPFLGKGIGTFMERFPHYAPNVYVHYAHNCFLQIWAETGIFSLLCFVAFLTELMRKGILVYRSNQNIMLLGLLGGMCGFLIHSFFDVQLYSIATSALFWAMAGFLSNLEKDSSS